MTIKLGTHTTYGKRTTPTCIDFHGQGSKVKVTRYTLLLNLVNTIQTEPFQPGPSNLVHRLLMTRGRHPIDSQGHGSKVKVTRYTSLYTLLFNLVNMIQIELFQLGLSNFVHILLMTRGSNLVHILLMTRGRTLLIFKVRGQRSRSQATHFC